MTLPSRVTTPRRSPSPSNARPISPGQRRDEVFQVLGLGGIGMVVGERAVHVAEQLLDLAAEAAVELGGEGTGHAVAAIDRDAHLALELHVANDAIEVGLTDLLGAIGAAPGGQVADLDALAQRQDVVAGERVARQHHFQAVVVGRVVAAGHHDAAAGAEVVGGEVEHRRGDAADVDHVDAAFLQAARQRLGKRRTREPAVAADADGLLAALARLRADRLADGLDRGFRQRLVDDAANVVGLEDFLGGRLRHGDSGEGASVEDQSRG
jgi:hypothetical protein